MYVTTTAVEAFPATAQGIAVLIWLAPAYRIGAAMPSNVTWVPPAEVVTKPLAKVAPTPGVGPSPGPSIVISCPAAKGCSKLAALPTT